MSDIKRRLQEISNPTVHNRRSFNTTAKVISINEKNNTCEIQYINKDGYYTNKSNVPVQLYMPSIIGWFPKKDDKILVKIVEDYVTIEGPVDVSYGANTRSSIQTRKDILTANFGGITAGNIF